MRTVSLKLPDSLHDQLAAAAREQGKSKSTVIREALTAFLNAETALPSVSCLDLVHNLAGCLNGPRDLSINRKHMTGFGR